MRRACFFLLLTLAGCSQDKPLFRLIPADESGIHFANTIVESDTLNALTFEYIYNGAGVGVADFNNDGYVDIFFAGNLETSRLYLNRGNFTFDDVTVKSNVSTSVWCVGVAVVDVNRDGWLDIYVSTIHPDPSQSTPNIFFINQGLDRSGIPFFKDQAAQLGLADSSYSSQAVFFDYDIDGDLDMYLLTNALENYTRNAPIGQRNDGTGKSVDRLYRQDTLSDGRIIFKDVSNSAGIKAEGWGLGVVVNDFNDDSWPDIYCANDFLSSDHLYINLQNGAFSDDIGEYMTHQEFNGMGADMADLNNDGLNDLVVVDMMPDDNLRQKTMFSGTGYDRFMKSIAMGYQPQYVRNVLQRNNGDHTFSDVGYQAGIFATDWSWSALLADFDNDGLRDIFITNGYPKDITDMDFVTYSKDASRFGTEELKLKNAVKAIQELGGVYKPNLMYRNKGELQFENVGDSWGFSHPTYSNGAAYADFDNDGDLDIVVSNLNGVAGLYENTTVKKENSDAGFLRIKFQGPSGNDHGIGAKVWIYSGAKEYYAEHQLQRGYLSSVDPVMHFGLGTATSIDSMVVVWPGEKAQVIQNVSANMTITVSYSEAKNEFHHRSLHPPLLVENRDITTVVQRESDYVDYKYGQATLPHKFSQQGPQVVVGDLDKNGLDDFVVGSTAKNGAKLFFQQPDGTFRVDSLEAKDAEDIGLSLFDADGDGDLDLYCVSGSSEFGRNSLMYQDRLYKNNGLGAFTLDHDALPEIHSSGSCVKAFDFDNDNDLDLFVGGRVVPLSYPESPKSCLLRNDGNGRFKDVTRELSDGLEYIGMVTDAIFTDYDLDGSVDLIVVGEWMPVSIFSIKSGKFTKVKELKTGWWNCIAEGDFDNDGDPDYIGGNRGLNSVMQASDGEPVSIYAKDFDSNGSMDPIISRYIDGKEYPVHYRETMTEQIVSLRRILRSYAQYGKMELSQITAYLGDDDMIVKRADWFASSYMENLGGGNFNLVALPFDAQISPLNGIIISDLNNDSILDFLAVGNSFSEEPLSGYYDAGIGVCALGRGDGTFQILSPARSGFSVRTDARAIAGIISGGERKWVVTSNQTPVRMFELSRARGELLSERREAGSSK